MSRPGSVVLRKLIWIDTLHYADAIMLVFLRVGSFVEQRLLCTSMVKIKIMDIAFTEVSLNILSYKERVPSQSDCTDVLAHLVLRWLQMPYGLCSKKTVLLFICYYNYLNY